MSSYMMPAHDDYIQEMSLLFVKSIPALLREVETGLYQNDASRAGDSLHSLVNNLSAVESEDLALVIRGLESRVLTTENISGLTAEWQVLKRDIMPVLFRVCSRL